jgi:plasmid stabilization system protein ParE
MAKQRVIWSQQAKLDLFEILDFCYKRNGSKTYSISLNASFRKAIKLIGKYPKLGVQTDIPNTRVLIEGYFVVFYVIKKEVIEISSIGDCRQNPNAINLSE